MADILPNDIVVKILVVFGIQGRAVLTIMCEKCGNANDSAQRKKYHTDCFAAAMQNSYNLHLTKNCL